MQVYFPWTHHWLSLIVAFLEFWEKLVTMQTDTTTSAVHAKKHDLSGVFAPETRRDFRRKRRSWWRRRKSQALMAAV
jgi:hypothetical protein